ncbi:MAG: hypothetical protein KJ663_07760 [Proteobacteria bacterium]|nr:hypothetical protein [Pseudomonadota bacterium]
MASLVVIFLAITAAGISMKGCGDTFASEEEAGTLHGEWFGSHYNEEAGTKPVVKGSIVHSATSDSNISGSMSIDNELYTLSGTYENGTLRATLNNPTAIIFWDGQYQGGRIQGTAYRLSSSTGGMESSLLSLVKFLDIGGVIEMGPWLLLAQDSATGLSSMTIRIA